MGWGTENTSGRAGLQDAVHLAEDARQVVDGGQGAGREDEVDRRAGGEAEVGQVALVELDAHLGPLRLPPGRRDPLAGRVDGHRLGAEARRR